MAEITWGGLWIKWSSLSRRDKRTMRGALCLVALATGFGILARERFEDVPATLSALDIAIVAAPIVAMAGAVWFLALFSSRQDELYRMMEGLAMRIAGALLCLGLFALMVVEKVFHIDLVSAYGAFMMLAAAYLAGWMTAVRKYL